MLVPIAQGFVVPEWGVALVAVTCALGIAGTVVPILPGSLLVGGAIIVWAVVEGTLAAWAVAVVAVLILCAGTLLKYLIPGKRLAAAGVPTLTLLVGGLVGVVGFFVIPIVGVIVGFIVGVFAMELLRLRDPRTAWPATWAAMKASGLSVLIELTAALLATALWGAGVVAT